MAVAGIAVVFLTWLAVRPLYDPVRESVLKWPVVIAAIVCGIGLITYANSKLSDIDFSWEVPTFIGCVLASAGLFLSSPWTYRRWPTDGPKQKPKNDWSELG